MSDGGRGFHPPGLTFLPDVSPARWVEEGLGTEFATVGALIPRGFASYVRLFHPARDENDGRVRWAEVAGVERQDGASLDGIRGYQRTSQRIWDR